MASVLVLISLPATGQPPTEPEQHEILQSAVRVGDTVFASIRSGIFRANVNEQAWQRLDLPGDVRPGGYFGEVKDKTGLLVYRSCSDARPRGEDDNSASGGIFVSDDLGKSWRKTLDCNRVGPTLLAPDGTLYAAHIIVKGELTLLAMSNDGGITWRDISNGIRGEINAFSEDPEHDPLICVHTHGGIRGYVWQAKDQNYDWTEYWEAQWYQRTKDHRDPFQRAYWTRNTAYTLPATLHNYFEYDFGDRVQIPGLTIAPEKPHYEFTAGEPMVIPVQIQFREDLRAWRPGSGRRMPEEPRKPTRVVLIDEPTGELWSIRVRHNGDVLSKGGELQREMLAARSPGGVDHWVAKKRKELALTQHLVDAETPLHRSIHLSEHEEFNTPGVFEVQFSYNSSPIAERNTEWSGYVNSPVVTITVRE